MTPPVPSEERKTIPDGLWVKCPHCKEILYVRELLRNAKICPPCGYHHPMNGEERAQWLMEELSSLQKKDALWIGSGRLGKQKIALGILDLENAQKEKTALEELGTLIEEALVSRLPLVCFWTSRARLRDATCPEALRFYRALDALEKEKLPFFLVLSDIEEPYEPFPLTPFADVALVETTRPVAEHADLQKPRPDIRLSLTRLVEFAGPENGKRSTR